MNPFDRRSAYIFRLGGPSSASTPKGPLARAAQIIGLTAVVIAGAMFSVVVFSAIMVAGVIGAGILWWRTRDVRRRMQETVASMQAGKSPADAFRANQPFSRGGGNVLEGEVIREVPDHKTPR